jgi:hypothetical protein
MIPVYISVITVKPKIQQFDFYVCVNFVFQRKSFEYRKFPQQYLLSFHNLKLIHSLQRLSLYQVIQRMRYRIRPSLLTSIWLQTPLYTLQHLRSISTRDFTNVILSIQHFRIFVATVLYNLHNCPSLRPQRVPGHGLVILKMEAACSTETSVSK